MSYSKKTFNKNSTATILTIESSIFIKQMIHKNKAFTPFLFNLFPCNFFLTDHRFIFAT